MIRTLKIILLGLLLGLLLLAGLLTFGLYTMEISDQYGHMQELYYRAKSGDVIVDRERSEFGIIEKSWKRINVRTPKVDSTDLYFWGHKNDGNIYIEQKPELYRPTKDIVTLVDLNYLKVIKMIDESRLKQIKWSSN